MNSENSRDMPDTRIKILDAAEALFAKNGYKGTSLRSITGKAEVNLAAVNYHFGSKRALLEEVISRRLLPLNKVRRQRIEQVRDSARGKGKKPDIRSVLQAFIEPTLLFKDSHAKAGNFFNFIGRAVTDPDDTVRKMFHRFIMPIFKLLFETSCEALPEFPGDVIFWRLHFTVGALFHTLHICDKFEHSGFAQFKTDMDANSLVNLIIPYVTAGMKAK